MTDKIYSTDAYATAMDAAVVKIDEDDGRVLLDATIFYPGGGGQPHDLGQLWVGEDPIDVMRVTHDSDGVWHWLDGGLPGRGTAVHGVIDWERRYSLMRTHTAMHAMCGVIWRNYQAPATGGNMKPGEGRLDFELPQWDPENTAPLEEELNRQLGRALPINVSFLPREEADLDPSLIRTKISLLPPSLREVRVIDIVGLDRQADGGTHVNSTAEVGHIEIVKVESKGREFRRIRFRIADD